MEPNNPASRLLSILKSLRGSPAHFTTGQVVADVFGVEIVPNELFSAVGKFHGLVEEVLSLATNQQGMPYQPFVRLLPHIRSAVGYTNFDAPWSHYSARITDECLLAIEMIAYAPSISQEEVTEEADLANLRDDLDQLFEYVIQSSKLDPALRKYLLEQIEAIRRCLAEYRISGSAGFVRYLETFLFQLDRHRETVKHAAEDAPEAVSRLKKVLGTVKKIVGASSEGITVLKQANKLVHDGQLLIEGISGSGSGDLPESPGADMA